MNIHFGPESDAPNGSLCVSVADPAAAAMLARRLYNDHIAITKLPNLVTTASAGYERAEEAFVDRCILLIDELGNSVRDAFEGVAAVCRNVTRFREAATSTTLHNVFAGQPAVCIGAGPSASDYLERYADALYGCRVFCCDAMSGTLNRLGIQPDFVTTVERPPDTAQLHDPGQDWSVLAPLFACPAAVAKYSRACWWLTADPVVRWLLHDYQPQNAVLSSGVLSVAGALHAGCDPIVLVGHDLAMAGERTHAGSAAALSQELASILSDSDPQLQRRSMQVDGTRTSHLWQMMRRNIEDHLARYPGRTVYRYHSGPYLPISGTTLVDTHPTMLAVVRPSHVPNDPGYDPSNPSWSAACAAEAMQSMVERAECVIETNMTGADAAHALVIDTVLGSHSSKACVAYLLQVLYSAAHMRCSLGRNYEATVNRLAHTIAQHGEALVDALVQLHNELAE